MSRKRLSILQYKQVTEFLLALDDKSAAAIDSLKEAISEVGGTYDPKKLKKLKPHPIFELRERTPRGAIRILAFYDKTDPGNTALVLCFAFFKKVQKTPQDHIKRALRLRAEYFK